MGRLPDILETIEAFCAQNRAFALVTLLEAEGSTPAKLGARAVVTPDGTIMGTIGGGALEGIAQQSAIEAIQSGQARVFDFDLQGSGTKKPDPICGGRLRVLVDPTAGRHRAVYARVLQARQRRERGVLLTTVQTEAAEPGLPMSVRVSVSWLDESSLHEWPDWPPPETLRKVLEGETVDTLRQALDGSPMEILIEAVVSKPRLLIVGGGHVGQALAHQASLVGFDIAVIDDREEFTRPERFPEGTETRCGEFGEQLAAFPFTADTFIALVTRGHQSDATALERCLHQPHAYLGMIGSRRKVALMRAAFLESGRATAEQWSRIHTPIGLVLGAVTVPEIATSIVAQLIAVRRNAPSRAEVP